MKKFLKILAFIWMKIVPFLLVLFFFVGVFFGLWKSAEWDPFIAALVSFGLFSAVGYGFLKMIKVL